MCMGMTPGRKGSFSGNQVLEVTIQDINGRLQNLSVGTVMQMAYKTPGEIIFFLSLFLLLAKRRMSLREDVSARTRTHGCPRGALAWIPMTDTDWRRRENEPCVCGGSTQGSMLRTATRLIRGVIRNRKGRKISSSSSSLAYARLLPIDFPLQGPDWISSPR